jgi:steroid delta-isomerase-like uncharacterized protein
MRYFHLMLAYLALAALAAPAHANEQDNVATAKRVFLEKMGEGRFDKLDEIYGPGFVAHGAGRDYTLEEDNESGRAWRAAFPDLKVTVERTAASGDLVAVHWRGTGTNTVAAAGMPGKGGKADIDGMTFFRFSAGRIVEEWSVIDIATLAKQLQQAKTQ